MKRLWEDIKKGYLRVIEPVADFLVRRRVSPNAITTFGTVCSMAGGVIYALGHIMTAGWLLSITALFDVLGAGDAGMEVTENYAMLPAASVSGFYLAHPDARYFAVGRIGDDQLADYAARSGVDLETARRLLAPNL